MESLCRLCCKPLGSEPGGEHALCAELGAVPRRRRTPPRDRWIVASIHLTCDGSYPFGVSGLNTCHRPGETFRWSVPNLDDPRYLLSPAMRRRLRELTRTLEVRRG